MAAATKDDGSAESKIWNQIDHTLARLKLSLISQEMERIEQQHLARLRLRNRNHQNKITDFTTKSEALALRIDEEVKRVYRAYCEVWTSQGQQKSGAFIRAVYQYSIAPGIANACSAALAKLAQEPLAIRLYPIIVKPLESAYRDRMNQLALLWKRRLEIEARESEHLERATKRASEASGTAVMASARLEGDTVKLQPTGESNHSSGPRLAKTTKAYRSLLKRAIFVALSRKPDSSNLEVCRAIDEDGLAELDGEDRTLESAYKDPHGRSKLQAVISKIRRDMSERGLL